MKKLILGLSGSGKTTMYQMLNENHICNAVEVELPPSCINDDNLKKTLFELYFNNPNIDCIISHYKFLPSNIGDYKYDLEVQVLNTPDDIRKERLKARTKSIDYSFFDDKYFKEEVFYKSSVETKLFK